jgi:uncharacterized protein (TIGR03067 family)
VNPTILLGLALGVGAPALKEKEATPSLVGEWMIEESTVGGKPSPPGTIPNRWVFRADGTRAIFGPEGKELVGGNYTTDSKGGTLDLDSTGAKDGMPYLCRYKVDGDTLTLNVGWQMSPRPPGFESLPDSKCTLYVMKRVKTKD